MRRAGWTDLGDGVLRFEIEANAFCHQMIRSIVGTLVDVGLGRCYAGELLGIIAGRDRSRGSAPGTPQGLCLWAVSYPPVRLPGSAALWGRTSDTSAHAAPPDVAVALRC